MGLLLNAWTSRDRAILVAGSLFVASALALACLSWTRPSAWILMTAPLDRTHHPNAAIGFSTLSTHGLLHAENLSAFRQVSLFNGGKEGLDLYFLRPAYGFLASLAAPFVGMPPAFALTNFLLWMLGAASVILLVRALGGDRLACGFAAVLALGGSGWAVHIGDWSAHLAGFAAYYVGVWQLVSRRIWRGGLDWREHLVMGCLLWVAVLAYSTSLYLVAAYCILAVRRRNWPIVFAVAAAAGAATFAWDLYLVGRLYVSGGGTSGLQSPWDFFLSHSLRRTEGLYLARAVDSWLSTPSAAGLARSVSHHLMEFATFDSPFVVLAGFVALVTAALSKTLPIPRSTAAVLLLTASLPIVGGLVWAPSAGARGYLVFAGSVGLYAAIAVATSVVIRSARRAGSTTLGLAGCVVLVLYGGHVLWSWSYLFGLLGPLKAYFLGLDDAAHLFVRPPIMTSLTGQEGPPLAFGSIAPPAMVPMPSDGSQTILSGAPGSARDSFAAKAFVAVPIGAAIAMATTVDLRKRMIGIGILACLVVLSTVAWQQWSSAAPPLRIGYGLLPPHLSIPAKERATYRVAIRHFASLVRAHAREGDYIEVVAPRADDVVLGVPAAGEPAEPCVAASCRMRLSHFLAIAERDPVFEVAITASTERAGALRCWQRPDLAGRHLTMDGSGGRGSPDLPCTPSIEFRLMSSARRAVVVGY
jgi:hypothetical protein